MITSGQIPSKGGVVAVEEGPHVMVSLVVLFGVHHWKGLAWKLCDNLVNGERHFSI